MIGADTGGARVLDGVSAKAKVCFFRGLLSIFETRRTLRLMQGFTNVLRLRAAADGRWRWAGSVIWGKGDVTDGYS